MKPLESVHCFLLDAAKLGVTICRILRDITRSGLLGDLPSTRYVVTVWCFVTRSGPSQYFISINVHH